MKAIRDNIIVKADKPKNSIGRFYLDTSFQPEKHTVISGEVISVGPKIKDVHPGDKIYFHFHCYSDRFKIQNVDDFYYLSIPRQLIYCKVNGNGIEPLSGTILCKPIKESEEGITTKSGILTKSNVENKPHQAIICYMPPDCELEIAEGDKVYFESNSDVPINIEGEKYLRMKPEWILGKLLN